MGKKNHRAHLYHGNDDKFFRKIHKNLPSESGPLVSVNLTEHSYLRRLQIKLNRNESNQILVFGERGRPQYRGENHRNTVGNSENVPVEARIKPWPLWRKASDISLALTLLLNQRHDLDKIHRQRTKKFVVYVAWAALLLEAHIKEPTPSLVRTSQKLRLMLICRILEHYCFIK